MFADQKHLDFAQNQAALLQDRINKKLNGNNIKVVAKDGKIVIFFERSDIEHLKGLDIPDRMGNLSVIGVIKKDSEKKHRYKKI